MKQSPRVKTFVPSSFRGYSSISTVAVHYFQERGSLSILFALIGGRILAACALSSVTDGWLDAGRHPQEETLENRIGARLRSRLYEMCRTVIVESEGYRRRSDMQQI